MPASFRKARIQTTFAATTSATGPPGTSRTFASPSAATRGPGPRSKPTGARCSTQRRTAPPTCSNVGSWARFPTMFDFIRKPLLWQAWDAGLDEEVLDIGEDRTRRQLLSQNVHTFQLKSMQDLAVYVHLRDLSGKQIAEVGAGNSRLLPRRAQANTCVAVERYEGQGGGPTTASPIPGVHVVPVFLGESSPLLAAESFDVVFSI